MSRGYRFIAIKQSFRALDGQIFESADEARGAALERRTGRAPV